MPTASFQNFRVADYAVKSPATTPTLAPPPTVNGVPLSLNKYLTSTSIEDMKSTVVQAERHWLMTQALPDTYQHIRALREEFTGDAEIKFFHAALIVKIRREKDLTESLLAFRSLWNAEGFYLLKNLSSRWILSALDTFIDHGDAHERAQALAIVTFFNMLKMAETEHRLRGSDTYKPEGIAENTNDYPLLWDGVRAFHLTDDDTFANIVRRIRKTLSHTPLFFLAFETLLIKATNANTMLSRMSQHHLRGMW